VQWEGNYARNLSPALRDPERSPSASLWAYIDAYDLATALLLGAEVDTPGHEVAYIASPDNHANRPLAELVRHHHGNAIELRELAREDASGISIAKAQRLLGYAPSRSWRDYLTEEGELRPEAAQRLERGETGVQRGRALTG
jgi:UDP-glucose 4-epimerase